MGRKLSYSDLLFFLISILSFTYLRKYFIIFLPVLFILTFVVLKLKFSPNSIILLVLSIISTMIAGFLGGFSVINNLLSIGLIFMPLFFFLSKTIPSNTDLSKRFIEISSLVLIIVNLSAFVDLFIAFANYGTDISADNFNGFYGKSGLAMHTLSLVNFIYAIYFYFKKKSLITAFFTISGFLCFFGAGLVTFIFSIGIYLLISKRVFKYIIPIFGLIILLWISLMIINPRSYNYYKANINWFVASFANTNYESEMSLARSNMHTITPRKLTFHLGVFNRLKENPEIAFIGIGPGMYNSRISFLLNGDYTKIDLLKKMIYIRPYYAEIDVYPLWNSEILFEFNDGTRNEPFSSVMALIMEYGIPISILIFLLYYLKIRKIAFWSAERKFIILSSIFYFLCLIGDNYIEYPEVTWVYLTIIKTMEIDAAAKKYHIS